MTRRARAAAAALVLALAVAPGLPAPGRAQEAPRGGRTLVAYLPSAPVESPQELAGAVTDLAARLSRAVGGAPFVPRIFRRWEDATAFLAGSPAEVALLVCDPVLLLELPADAGVEPLFRFVRDGRETHRQILVVRAAADAPRSLAELRGRSLAAVHAEPGRPQLFLERAVFRGELQPSRWFGRIEPATDHLAAAVAVLYGSTEAALVSEDTPLLAAHLGSRLRAVYEGAPTSLPVVAVRAAAWTAEERAALERALESLPQEAPGLLAPLRVQRLARVPPGDGPLARGGLLRLPGAESRPMEVALPPVAALALEPLPPPRPAELPWAIAIELPEVELPPPAPPDADAGPASPAGREEVP